MSPEFQKQLQDVLTHAFEKNGLKQLATLRLLFPEVQFADAVNFDVDKVDIAFQMVQLAAQHGYVEQLVRAVQAERPNLPEVAALVVAFERGAGSAAPAQPIDIPAKAKDAVIRFNERFQQRQKQ